MAISKQFDPQQFAGAFGGFGGLVQTQANLPTAGDFRASDQIGTELLQTGVDPATRTALEAAGREKALGEGGGAVGQSLVNQNIIGGQNLEQIAGLTQESRDLLGGFGFNATNIDQSGLQQFAGLGGQGIDLFGQGQTTFGQGQDLFQQGAQGAAGLLADPSSILNDPLIQAQLQQGTQAAEMGAAAGGTQLSGGQLRELQGLGQTFAGSQIEAQFGRFQQLAGLGAQQSQLGLSQSGLGLQGAQLGLGAEQFGIQTDLAQQQGNQAGLLGFQQLQLGGQEQVANLALAGIGLRGDLAQQELGVQLDLLGSRQAKRSARKAAVGGIVGAGIGAAAGGFGAGGAFAPGGKFG